MRTLDLSDKYTTYVDKKGDTHTWCNECSSYVTERNMDKVGNKLR